MDKKPIGLAVIGTGRWGTGMGHAVQRCKEFQIVTCCTRTKAKGDRFAQEFRCDHDATIHDVLKNDAVEAVLLTTPNTVHAEHAVLAAEHGKHVLVEKPIAASISDARRMIEACKDGGVVLAVAHNQRRLAGYRRIKALLNEGSMGKVVSVESNFSHNAGFKLTPEFWRWHENECPGGPMMTMGVHAADTLQYLLGPVESVSAFFERLCLKTEIMDTGVAILQFESGTLGYLASNYVTPWNYFFNLYGTEGNLYFHLDLPFVNAPATEKYGDNWNYADRHSRLYLKRKGQDDKIEIPLEPGEILKEELEEFADCIRTGSMSETGGEEGLRALAVILGAIRSAESGSTVKIDEILAEEQ